MTKQPRDSKGKFGLVHGARSAKVAERYSDLRTTEGQALQRTLDAIVSDLGGQQALNGSQRLLMDMLRSKLIVVAQVGKYIDTKKSLIEDGQLIPVLGKNYLSYFNTIRQTLQDLYKDYDPVKAVSREEWQKTVSRGD